MIATYSTDEEFHAQRQKTVGSSDIPTLLGLNAKYDQTPYTLWKEKTGRAKGFEGNEYTEWGHRLETVILSKFIDNLCYELPGKQYLQDIFKGLNQSISYHNGDMVRLESYSCAIHDKYPFALAHADLWIPELSRIQEAKSGSFYGTKRANDPDTGYDRENLTSNGIPLSVYVQTIWQMFCYEAELCGVSALIDTSHYLEYGPWKLDTKLAGRLLEIADKFMWHVNNDKPPMPTTWKDYEDLFPFVNDTACVYPLDYKLNENELTLGDMIEVYHSEKRKEKKAKEKLDDIKKAIGILMGENRTLQTPDGQVLVTMSLTEKETVKGLKAIEKEFPGMGIKLKEAGLITESKYKTPKIRSIGI